MEVVPDVDGPGVGVSAGVGAERAGPVVAVGSVEGSSGPTGLGGVLKGRGRGRGRGRVRGRPRKYKVDGDRVGLPSAMSESMFSASLVDYAGATAGRDFTVHVLIVPTGEDVVRKISLCFQGPRSVCIISATGVLSSVIIHHFGPSGSFRQYDGTFQILQLTGSYTPSANESGDVHRIDGKLRITLAKPNGEVFAGVAGTLTAAEPIQLIVGSYRQNSYAAAARIPRVPKLGGVPGVHISKMTDGDDDTCTAPASTSLEAAHGGADLGGVPGVHISKMTGGDDDTCIAPTSTSLEAVHGGADLGGVPGVHISKMTGGDDDQ